MKVFITGIAGFLGSHLADHLLAEGHHVEGCDSLVGSDDGDVGNTPQNVRVGLFDCRELPVMKLAMVGVDVVFHCACLAHESLSVFSPYLIGDSVFGGTMATASAAIENGVKRFVFLSSAARYGSRMPPFVESMNCWPQDVYGIAKLAAEDALKTLGAVHGMEIAIAVPHNIIGPRQRYDDPYRNVAAIMINRMLQGLQPVIYGNGSQRRSFSHVADVVPALAKMGFEKRVCSEVINLGPDEDETTVLDLARLIAMRLQFELDPIFVADRPQEVHAVVCSADKARRLLGYKTTRTLEDAIDEMVRDIEKRGPKPFDYALDVEIVNDRTPKAWTERKL